jgi:hypothetical protein
MAGGFVDNADVLKAIGEMTGETPDPLAPGLSTEPVVVGDLPGEETPVEPPAAAGGVPPAVGPAGGFGEEEPEEEEAGEVLAEGMVQLPDGSVISTARLQELATIDQAFRQDPRIAGAVREAVERNGIAAVAPPPQPAVPPIPGYTPQGYTPAPAVAPQPVVPAASFPPVQLPPDVDPDDPTVRWIVQQQQAQSQQLAQREQAIQQQLAAQQQRSASAGIQEARAKIAQTYPHLTFDDIASAEAQASARGLGYHFTSMYGEDYGRAFYEAIETAAVAMPELRPKILAPAPAASVTPIRGAQGERAKKLTALAGSGGTAPRTEPAPQKLSREQKVEGMAEMIAQSLAANT